MKRETGNRKVASRPVLSTGEGNWSQKYEQNNRELFIKTNLCEYELQKPKISCIYIIITIDFRMHVYYVCLCVQNDAVL